MTAPRVPGHLVGGVLAPVDHHQRGDGKAADLRGHGLEDRTEVVLLLVGADEGHHRGEGEPGVVGLEPATAEVDDEALEGLEPPVLAVRDAAGHQSRWGRPKTERTSGSKCSRGRVG